MNNHQQVDQYASRVSQLEREGCTTSDAQAVADAEEMTGALGDSTTDWDQVGNTPVILVDGINRPTHNNEGHLIHITTEGLINFWRWFNESKAVDQYGRPMVVYHGTENSFTTVDLNKCTQPIFWVTTNLEALASRSMGAQGFGKVMALYVKIESPANWKQYDNLMLDEFKSRGLDGAILSSEHGKHFEAFIMTPNQVKSSTQNNGEFDPNNPSMIDKVKPPTFKYKV